MRSRKLAALAFAVVLIVALLFIILSGRKAYAQTAGAGPTVVPKSYGTLKGSIGAALIFEDSSGTIRLVEVDSANNGRWQTTFVRR